MSCTKCEEFQKSTKTFYIRVGAANVEVRACREHVKIVFNKLNNYDDLLEVCKKDEEFANLAILSVPTSSFRDHLTELNILRLAAIKRAEGR